MRITDAIIQTGAVDSLRKTAGKSIERAESSEKVRKDSVQISKKARSLSESAEQKAVSARANAMPDVRQDRIQEVKERINSGFYDSDEFNDKLADKLLKNFWGSEG